MNQTQISARQTEILNFIKQFIIDEGYAPSIRNIGKAIFTSPSVVLAHLVKLEDNGLIERMPNKARTIKVMEQGEPIIDPKLVITVKALETIKLMLDMDHSDYQKYLIWNMATESLKEVGKVSL